MYDIEIKMQARRGEEVLCERDLTEPVMRSILLRQLNPPLESFTPAAELFLSTGDIYPNDEVNLYIIVDGPQATSKSGIRIDKEVMDGGLEIIEKIKIEDTPDEICIIAKFIEVLAYESLYRFTDYLLEDNQKDPNFKLTNEQTEELAGEFNNNFGSL